jgi:hypothetical protein
MAEGVSIAEAARRLGVSADTVRRRLHSGTLPGHKEATPQGYVWRVDLPGAHVPPTQPPMQQEGDTITRALVDMLRTQLAEKDRQLAERAREVEQLHVLLQNTQRLIPAAAPETPQGAARPAEDKSPAERAIASLRGAQRVSRASETRPPWWMRLLRGK